MHLIKLSMSMLFTMGESIMHLIQNKYLIYNGDLNMNKTCDFK